MKICILGAGLIGTAMAMDLSSCNEFNVASVDFSEKRLEQLNSFNNIRKIKCDLSDNKVLSEVVREFDLVVNALPSVMGYSVLKTIIETGKDVVDITFFEEDPFTLSELAEKKNVTAIVDCGIAPGMSNILTGYISNLLDETSKVRIYVGGVPLVKEYPWEYKAGFAPEDVINEYMRPARYVKAGKIISVPALTEPELLEFEDAGILEAFNTDGLRSLLSTISAPDMKEQTLRYPGHIEKILMLKASGFFSETPIIINGQEIKPIEFTSTILFPHWTMTNGDEDMTVFRVEVSGIKNGKEVKYTYNMVDKYDKETHVHSMARSTGYTATSVVKMFARKLLTQKGLIVPEYIGKNEAAVNFLLASMKEKGIEFKFKVSI